MLYHSQREKLINKAGKVQKKSVIQILKHVSSFGSCKV